MLRRFDCKLQGGTGDAGRGATRLGGEPGTPGGEARGGGAGVGGERGGDAGCGAGAKPRPPPRRPTAPLAPNPL